MAGFIILMGVSGSGKTVIGEALAPRINAEFIDGDHLHSQRNIDKMAGGTPLTDEDRIDWLKIIARVGHEHIQKGLNCIIACSALKRSYRDIIRENNPYSRFVYLKGSFELILSRISKRSHQYMPSTLLQSQFDTLEEPRADEQDILIVSIDQDIDAVVDEIIAAGLLNSVN